MFICIDGIDGSGKSTQVELLAEYLRSTGRDVVVVRDPGGTPLGNSLREILLHKKEIPICPVAELLVYMASRAQLVEEQIKPAIAAELFKNNPVGRNAFSPVFRIL